MYNDLLTIGNFTIHGYGLMIGIGIIAAYLMAEHLARKKGLDPDQVFYLLIFGVLGGIIGAKLLYWITIWDEIVEDPSILLDLSNGFVIYGGIILGILSGYLVCRVKKLNFWKYLDCATPAIALAQGFGRIGCFLAGCCYGVETDSWFSITFTNSDFAPNGVALVPTQLISSAFDFVHFAILYTVTRKTKVDGLTSALYMIIYGCGRFIIEFYRGDLERGTVGDLSTSQFISIFVVAFGIFLLAWKWQVYKSKTVEMTAATAVAGAGAQVGSGETVVAASMSEEEAAEEQGLAVEPAEDVKETNKQQESDLQEESAAEQTEEETALKMEREQEQAVEEAEVAAEPADKFAEGEVEEQQVADALEQRDTVQEGSKSEV